MKPENWIAIGSAVLTASLTAIGLYVGPKLAVKRSLEQFRSQKLWEKKALVYEEIIRAASRLCTYHTQQFDAELSKALYTDEWRKEQWERTTESRQILEQHMYSGGFLLTEEAEKAVWTILNDTSAENEAPFEYHQRRAGELHTAIAELKVSATIDLG